MKTLRIAMLSSFYAPHRGGTERYVEDLSLALVDRGHAVTVFSHYPGPRQKAGDEAPRIVRIPALWTPYNPYAAFLPKRHLMDHDIIHTHAPPFFFISQAVRIKSLPQVLTYHCDIEIPPHLGLFELPGPSKRLLDLFFTKTSRVRIKGVDAIVATTESYAESSPVLRSVPYRVIPLGIHVRNFMAARKRLALDDIVRNGREVLYVGRLVASKGLAYLLEAARLMRDRGINFTLTIAGTGEEYFVMKKHIRSYRLEGQVRLIGAVSEDELYALYSRAAVFVLPSFVRLEAFGIVQLEALAMGLPVIASDLPGVNETVRKSGGGWLVQPGDSRALAQTIAFALDHPEEREARGTEGRRYVERNYDWNNIAGRFEELYRELCEDKRRATGCRHCAKESHGAGPTGDAPV